MVVIKDMGTTICCGECRFCGRFNPDEDICKIDGHIIKSTLATITQKRDSNCPLVEIGTCKDCKWWDSENNKIGYCNACKHGHCSSSWNISIYRRTKADFYCSDFEKRDNNKPKTYIDCQKCENYRNPDYSKCMECEKRGNENG